MERHIKYKIVVIDSDKSAIEALIQSIIKSKHKTYEHHLLLMVPDISVLHLQIPSINAAQIAKLNQAQSLLLRYRKIFDIPSERLWLHCGDVARQTKLLNDRLESIRNKKTRINCLNFRKYLCNLFTRAKAVSLKLSFQY